MQDDENTQLSCGDLSSDVESNEVRVHSPTKASHDGSSLGSGQIGVAPLKGSVAAHTCLASSENSSQSHPSLKAHDYIGLSEISSRAVLAEEPFSHKNKQETEAGDNLDLGFQETELRLGLPQPEAAGVEVAAPFKLKQGYVPAAMEGKEAEACSAPFGPPSGIGGPTSHPSFLNVIKPCENGETAIAPGAYSREPEDGAMQNMSGRSEICKRRYAGENVHVWDLGIGFTPQITGYLQEEVGENKVSCCATEGPVLKTTMPDMPEQPSKNQENTHVSAPLESAGEEHKSLPSIIEGNFQQDMDFARQRQLLKGSMLAHTEYAHFRHEAHGSPYLQEPNASHKYWQGQMTPRVADYLHLPRNYELHSPQFAQDMEISKAGFGRDLNGITGAEVLPGAATRHTMAGAKRVFSEAIGCGEVAVNEITKVANSVTADSESKINLQLKHQPPSPRFSWSSTKQSLASWRAGLERPIGVASFGVFTSPGQSLIKGDANVPPQDCHFEMMPGKPTPISKKPQVEAGRGHQDVQSTVEHDKVETTPRAPVGWPPVQSFRKNSLPPPKPKKPVEIEARPIVGPSPSSTAVPTLSECLFVKVYMDGLPIGRKVDLKICNNYEKLSMALEDMFQGFFGGHSGGEGPEDAMSSKGKKLNLLTSSDYVITYEDKDGDLMLVGDVPWGMFLATVKRLRIMKGSEAIGLAPGPGDKIKCC